MLEEKQNDFIKRDTKNFVDGNLALAGWRTVYQQRNCDEMFAEFNRIFLKIFEKNAATEKIIVSNIKKTTSEKPWTKQIQYLVAKKLFMKKKLERKTTVQTSLKLMRSVKKTKDKKLICNAFNRVYSEIGIYRGQIVLLNVKKIERIIPEFNFRPFILREILKLLII